jgi:hypothetical protein
LRQPFATFLGFRDRKSKPLKQTVNHIGIAGAQFGPPGAETRFFDTGHFAKGQTLVIRGGGSSFGRAAINMAVNAGVFGCEAIHEPHCVMEAGQAGGKMVVLV